MSELACPECGTLLNLPPEQVEAGVCPRCGATFSVDQAQQQTEPLPLSSWWEKSVSMLVSIVLHAAVMVALALLSYGGRGVAGEGEEVLIGQMPGETLSEQQDMELSSEPIEESTTLVEEQLEEIEPASTAPAESTDSTLAAIAPSSSGSSGSGMEFEVTLPGTGAGGSGGNWDAMIQTLRRNGLDIVIVFDSTGSMGGEIDQVKNQIERIGTTLLKLVPKTQISLCTYRDEDDDYVVRGIPLTDQISDLVKFLDTVYASGGGDTPESVHAGMEWAVRQNQFRPRARKIILIFGDAPPHNEYMQRCLQVAADFQRSQQGIVSTVTCRGSLRLDEFVQIARAGGGEAFLTSDERQIMTQLMVLVFGSKHKAKVLEAFRLLDER